MTTKKRDTDMTEIVYEYIKTYIEDNKFPPTYREIARNCSIGVGTVIFHLDKLEAFGRLTRAPRKTRSIQLVEPGQEYENMMRYR